MSKQIKVHPPRVTGLRNRPPISDGGAFRSADLLDAVIDFLGLKNDAALGRELQVAPPILSKVRNGGLPVSAAILLRMHEASGLSIHELRACMGDHRKRFGIPDEPEEK
ncbi:hypothetical protein [Janthinobacterium lividum]|jgi:hypothetical protein|uniref:hypothetical protein n=1 Tax=Janthinobacterium lividum TaxID=29581 RepID=UPI0008FCD4E0|nr:hypothetical protein [Janthinobacterium lividum]MCC7717402.1 hypothetical protein [Janthinobacterium lividum]WQE31955.1 hypothetical protein U0004_29100 [Janthinobacterium lividum]